MGSKGGLAVSTLLAALLGSAGCGDGRADDGPPGSPLGWTCPVGWVAHEAGGCGPAALLCAPRGGAAPAACEGVDLGPGSPSPFYLGAGGELTGRFVEDGDDGAPPPIGWTPAVREAPCPEGWAVVDGGACAATLSADCAAGAAPLPDGTCTRTGTDDCPTGTYPPLPDLPAGARVVHVLSSADPTAPDGTEGAPFPTLAAAIDAAGEGGVVRVGPGVYAERPVLSRSVRVAGLCAAQVWLTQGLEARGADAVVTLEGLGFRDTPTPAAVVVDGGAQVTVRRARLERPGARGVFVTNGGRLVAEDVAVFDVVEVSEDVTRGRGFSADLGSRLSLTRVVVDGYADFGVFLGDEGTRLEVTDATFRDARGRTGGGLGEALWAQTGAQLRAERVAIADARDAAVLGVVGASIVLRDVDVDGVGAAPDGGVGFGLVAQDASRFDVDGLRVRGATGSCVQVQRDCELDLAHALLDGCVEGGVSVGMAGGVAHVRDAWIRDVASAADGNLGRGLEVSIGGRLEARRVRVERAPEVGVLALGAGSTLVLEDVLVTDISGRADGEFGRGLEVGFGAIADARRLRVVDVKNGAVAVGGEGATLRLEDSVLAGVGLLPSFDAARGLFVREDAHVFLTRTRIEEVEGEGIVALGPRSDVTLEDVVVRDIRPVVYLGAEDVFGYGVDLIEGATLAARGLLVEDVSGIGLRLLRTGAHGPIEDVVVRRVSANASGMGVGVMSDFSVPISRLTVAETTGAAVEALILAGRTCPETTLDIADLYVTSVRSGHVRSDPTAPERRPAGPTVAYGVHSTGGCRIDLARSLILGGGYGLSSIGVGEIQAAQVVVASQLDAAAVLGSPEDRIGLGEHAFVQNAVNEVTSNGALPAASALPPPSAVCTLGADGC